MPNPMPRDRSFDRPARRGGSGRAACRRSPRSPPSRCSSPPATGSSGRMDDEGGAARAVRRGGRAAPVALPPAASDGLERAALSAGRRRRANSTRARQILIDNKVHDGRAGYHVVTPLALADGRVVLVDRGWIAAGRVARRAAAGRAARRRPVTVRGRVAIPAGRRTSSLRRDTPSGTVWQNLDPARFAAATGHRGAAGRRRADRAAPRAGRRARARLAGAGFRHRAAPDLHGAVVFVRRAGGRAVARASTCVRAQRGIR